MIITLNCCTLTHIWRYNIIHNGSVENLVINHHSFIYIWTKFRWDTINGTKEIGVNKNIWINVYYKITRIIISSCFYHITKDRHSIFIDMKEWFCYNVPLLTIEFCSVIIGKHNWLDTKFFWENTQLIKCIIWNTRYLQIMKRKRVDWFTNGKDNCNIILWLNLRWYYELTVKKKNTIGCIVRSII